MLKKGVESFQVNNEDTRGTSMFLNVSMSMRLFWWIQLYLDLFQHLSFHNLFHFVHGDVHDEANMVYLLTPQGAQSYEVHNVLLNLLLGAQTFLYQKT